MKRLRKSVILLFLIAMCLFICSCGRSKKAECPFTEITWENTLDEVLALEGEPLDSYPSTYSGTTYTFSKDFHDMSGTIKYMFDDNDRLMSMAWLYIPESKDDLENVYQTLCDETTQAYGESGFDSDMGTAKGNVCIWKVETSLSVLCQQESTKLSSTSFSIRMCQTKSHSKSICTIMIHASPSLGKIKKSGIGFQIPDFFV